MSNTWTTPMPWNNTGVAPSETLQDRGIIGGDPIPADILNYAFHSTQQCVMELQDAVDGINVLPDVTSDDNGKFLRVVGGAWTALAVPNAEEASF